MATDAPNGEEVVELETIVVKGKQRNTTTVSGNTRTRTHYMKRSIFLPLQA